MRATDISSAFDSAHHAILAEESLERKYRLEPSPAVRRLHQTAANELIAALNQAGAIGDAEDRAIAERAINLHAPYALAIHDLFAAVDAGDARGATAIDNAEVDPSFDAIAALVNGAADSRSLQADRYFATLATIEDRFLVGTPIVFAIGAVLVVVFWRLLRGLQRQAEAAATRETDSVRRNERRYRALVQSSSDVVLICDAEGAIGYQSPTATTVWGYPPNGLITLPLAGLTHADDALALEKFWAQLRSVPGATHKTELPLKYANDEWVQSELILTNCLRDEGVDGIVVTARDISERKAFEQQLIQQAFYDSLTHLPNRALLMERLEQALVRAGAGHGPVGLLFADLDNFKLINDSLGHQLGDELLVEAAARLQGCLRLTDTVARLGGDEFVILLGDATSQAEAETISGRVAAEFAKPFQLAGREFVVTASVGVAIGMASIDRADDILRNADIAMYRAKTSGRGRHVVFEASMHTDALTRLELENDLRRGIDRGELRVFYQPIVTLPTGWITEVEALVRWQHPTRGFLLPIEFISLAEESGLIIPLGQWVLSEACRQAQAWRVEFPDRPPVAVSVNLSPRQFQQPSLVDEVNRALLDSGLPATSLKLEITEAVIMRDTEATIATLWQLKGLGIKLAIDDFGTGYSSLAYLKRLPLDVLKIDQSFVNGIGVDANDTAIVRAIIQMAKSLGLAVTGEGIETAAQAALLESWDCERGQGYLFSRPLDAAHMAAAMRNPAAVEERNSAA